VSLNAGWQEVCGVVVAIGLMTLFGRALVMFFVREIALEWPEVWALSFLAGAGGVSLLLFWLSPLFAVVPARWLVSIAMAGLGFAAWRQGRTQPRRRDDRVVTRGAAPRWILTALSAGIAIQCGALVLMALQTSLGWDGLMNFEIKARMAFANQPAGRIPLTYLSDASRAWSHPGYPLLLPLTEYWLYSWIGHPHQGLIKLLFPAFYLSLAGLFYGALRRMLTPRDALAGCLALGLVPSLAIGPGAAISGYADVPLAAAGFGSVACAYFALRTGARDYFAVAAVLSSIAAWTKREGLMLAAYVAVAVTIVHAARARREGQSLTAAMSGVGWLFVGPALVVGPWWLLQSWYRVADQDFVSVTVRVLQANVSRVPVIAGLFARELILPGHWGLLWPAFGVTLILSVRRLGEVSERFLAGAVLFPMGIYAASFVFSAWPQYTEHIGTALPRLLVPLAPVALFVAIRHLRESLAQPPDNNPPRWPSGTY
jgi:hypothetical protein